MTRRADIWQETPSNPRQHNNTCARPPAPQVIFPVVIGEGSHPFPFRTRKLSSLPPMVLHG